jgi:hypothetical protein
MLGGLLGFAGLAAAPAQAEVLTFRATLDGRQGVDPTGSAATGKARVRVDTKRQTVSVDLTLNGITTDALWDELVAAPIGPIHFHKYATPQATKDSVLVLPVPYDAGYRATRRGLRVSMKNYEYMAGAKLLRSKLSFDEFLAALRGGLVVLNVHTDRHNSGEISGKVEAH